jgi:hypothetical protein|tara:strand:+ start:39 stop:410 length:372 start_codon:yes stop_codon:yes gene_type:complete
MKKPLHNLFGIVFILIIFCFFVTATALQYLTDNQIEDFPQKYERFIDEMFTLEYFFWGFITLFLMGFLSLFFCVAIALTYTFLVKWPGDLNQLTFKSLINTYTIIGFIMIYAWFFVFLINNTF